MAGKPSRQPERVHIVRLHEGKRRHRMGGEGCEHVPIAMKRPLWRHTHGTLHPILLPTRSET